ncbi:MAG: hypothetical protein KF767_05315 [Bdellovibrionaceae bacterium]|nr:hypothetical protein [Pseudobdellovibrionaceae bacterium]
MSVRPIWAIFAFVTSSILVAGGYHALTLSGTDRQPTPASWNLNFLTDEKLWGKGAPASCEPGNMKLWKDFPPIFRAARYRHGGDVQQRCLSAASTALPSISSGACAGETDSCARDEELLVTYNVMLDVTDCFEIAQREFLPLIASQTGPRLSLMALDDARTTGLLREQDWNAFQSQWPGEIARLKSSDKNSCRRLGALFNKTTPPEAPQACGATETAQESLIVLLAAAQRFQAVTQEITDLWEPALIDANLAELDTRIEDRMILRYFTHLLAYFEDAPRAIEVARNFVEKRNEDSARIQPGELSWAMLLTADRRPASVNAKPAKNEFNWAGHLRKNLTPSAQSKMERVATWLAWVRAQELAGDCATELWTMDSVTENPSEE